MSARNVGRSRNVSKRTLINPSFFTTRDIQTGRIPQCEKTTSRGSRLRITGSICDGTALYRGFISPENRASNRAQNRSLQAGFKPRGKRKVRPVLSQYKSTE